MLSIMKMDKKVAAKKIRFVLLHSLGKAFMTADYDASLLEQLLEKTGD